MHSIHRPALQKVHIRQEPYSAAVPKEFGIMHPGHAERQNALRTDGKLSIQRPVQPAVATYNEYRNRAPRVLRQLRTNY